MKQEEIDEMFKSIEEGLRAVRKCDMLSAVTGSTGQQAKTVQGTVHGQSISTGQTLTIAGGIAGQYMISNGNGSGWVSVGSSGGGYTDAQAPKRVEQSKAPTLPPIEIEAEDLQTGLKAKMLLRPEPNVTANESLKLTMLMFAYASSSEDFNALEYIRQNNLERHFSYS